MSTQRILIEDDTAREESLKFLYKRCFKTATPSFSHDPSQKIEACSHSFYYILRFIRVWVDFLRGT